MTVINEYGESVSFKADQHPSIADFALSYHGLNKTAEEVRVFTEKWFGTCPQGSFHEFIRAYRFAFSQEGLDKSSLAAEKFAFSWVRSFPRHPFSVFIRFYRQELRKGRSPEDKVIFERIRKQCTTNTMYKEITYEHGSNSENGNKGLLSITAGAGKDGDVCQ
jgi:hypothetical protein